MRGAMMTVSTTDVFQSHHEVIDALNQNYTGSNDPQRAITVGKLREDLGTACQRQQEDVKTAIIGNFAGCVNVKDHISISCCFPELSQQVRETQEEATPREPPEAHEERVQSLCQSTHEAKENVDSLNDAAR